MTIKSNPPPQKKNRINYHFCDTNLSNNLSVNYNFFIAYVPGELYCDVALVRINVEFNLARDRVFQEVRRLLSYKTEINV